MEPAERVAGQAEWLRRRRRQAQRYLSSQAGVCIHNPSFAFFNGPPLPALGAAHGSKLAYVMSAGPSRYVCCAPCLQSGMFIGGEKYMMVAGEPGEVLRGKKGPGEDFSCWQGAAICTVQKDGVPLCIAVPTCTCAHA